VIQDENPKMASSTTPTFGKTALNWWSGHIGGDTPSAKALSARLRRSTIPSQSLSERAVVGLVEAATKELGADSDAVHALHDPIRLHRVVSVLAHVRVHEKSALFALAGKARRGNNPPLSELRFKRVLSATGKDIPTAVRRVVQMTDGRANVASLATDILFHGEKVLQGWCFDYYQALSRPSTRSHDFVSHVQEELQK